MSVQTQVDLRIANATPGLIADIHAGNQIISATLESAEADFGIVVRRGTDPDNQAVVGGDETGILGITVRSVGKEPANIGGTPLTYLQGETMSVMKDGFIFARCEDGCNAEDRVVFNNATGTLTANASPTAGQTQIDNSEWMETVAAGQVGKLRLDGGSSLTAGS